MSTIEIKTDESPFGKVPLWLLDSGVSFGAIVAFATLWVRWSNRSTGDNCYPSQSLMAESMGVSKRSVQGYLKELEDVGAILVSARHREDGSRSANLYELFAARPHEAGFTPPGSQLRGGVEAGCVGPTQSVAQQEEPEPYEPEPMNQTPTPTPPASPSAPQDDLSTDASHAAIMDGIVDSGALSPAAPEVYNEPSPVDEAISLLEEQYPGAKPRPALVDSNGKPHAWCRELAVPQLVEVVDLSVCFSEATRDVGGNRYPNPFTKGACEPLRRLMYLDGFSAAQITAMTGWVTQNEFWSSNVACTSKLRDKWDQLRSQRNRDLKKAAEIRERDSGPADGTTEAWMIRSAPSPTSDPSIKVDA